jgi:hypothetical protein
MRLNKILSLALVSSVFVLASIPAQAQGSFGIGFSKFGKHSSLSIAVAGRIPVRHRPVIVRPAGHFETRCVRVWVPGCERTVYIEPIYETFVDPCGNVSRVLVRPGYTKIVVDSGHFETRCSEVWVDGFYR